METTETIRVVHVTMYMLIASEITHPNQVATAMYCSTIVCQYIDGLMRLRRSRRKTVTKSVLEGGAVAAFQV